MATAVLSDGAAMLLALVRRKGCADALADWIWDNLPPVGGAKRTVVHVSTRSIIAAIVCIGRNDDGVWLRFYRRWSGKSGRELLHVVFVGNSRLFGEAFGASRSG